MDDARGREWKDTDRLGEVTVRATTQGAACHGFGILRSRRFRRQAVSRRRRHS